MVLGLGDRVGGRKRGGVGGGGGIIETFVMDGQKDNDVVSTAYRCLLLEYMWYLLIWEARHAQPFAAMKA